METVANSLVCHANHVLSVAAIRKAHLSTAGPDPCNRCVCVLVGAFVCMRVGGSGSLCVCELVKGLYFLRQCCLYLKKTKNNKKTHITPGWLFKFATFVRIAGRRVRAAERGVCHVVIVCGNCLISLTSASNSLTPTKQSNNYYMTRTQTHTHTDTSDIRWTLLTFSL